VKAERATGPIPADGLRGAKAGRRCSIRRGHAEGDSAGSAPARGRRGPVAARRAHTGVAVAERGGEALHLGIHGRAAAPRPPRGRGRERRSRGRGRSWRGCLAHLDPGREMGACGRMDERSQDQPGQSPPTSARASRRRERQSEAGPTRGVAVRRPGWARGKAPGPHGARSRGRATPTPPTNNKRPAPASAGERSRPEPPRRVDGAGHRSAPAVVTPPVGNGEARWAAPVTGETASRRRHDGGGLPETCRAPAECSPRGPPRAPPRQRPRARPAILGLLGRGLEDRPQYRFRHGPRRRKGQVAPARASSAPRRACRPRTGRGP